MPRTHAKKKTKKPQKSWSADTIQFLTQAELKKLLSVISNTRDYAIFLVAYRHGLRASEVGMLRVGDINLKEYRIRINRRKKSRAGVYPMQPDEVKAIKTLLKARSPKDAANPVLFLSRRSEPISERQIDRLMKQYGEQAGLPHDKRHFHVLKHSICTHMLDAGSEIRFVQDWVGHSSIKNTIIYAQLTSTRRDEEARKAFLSGKIV
jgi:site-specific recombinase XerC